MNIKNSRRRSDSAILIGRVKSLATLSQTTLKKLEKLAPLGESPEVLIQRQEALIALKEASQLLNRCSQACAKMRDSANQEALIKGSVRTPATSSKPISSEEMSAVMNELFDELQEIVDDTKKM